MAIAVFAYLLSIHGGLQNLQQGNPQKYTDGTTAKAESTFRVGINKIAAIITSLENFLKYLTSDIQRQLSAYIRSPKSIFV